MSGLQGNRIDEYKTLAAKQTNDREKVTVWLERIKRAQALLRLAERAAIAEKIKEYMVGKAPEYHGGKTLQKFYQPYLYPILKDAFSRTVQAIPAPAVEADDETTDAFADRARSVLAVAFRDRRVNIRNACTDALWGDASWGAAFFKVTWRLSYTDAQPEHVTDEEIVSLQVTDAQMENADPQSAMLADADIHAIHMKVHAQHLDTMLPEDPMYGVLSAHMQAHRAESLQILHEHPYVEVLRADRYVYDPDKPWHERDWEAELRSRRISTLRDMGMKNLNPENLPPEEKPGEQREVPYEDMTALVWEIHDRRTGQWFIIPAKTHDGLFLHKGEWPWKGQRGDIDIYVPFVAQPWQMGTTQLDGIPVAALCMHVLDQLAVIDAAIARHVEEHLDYKWFVPQGFSKELKRDLNDPNKKFIEVGPEAMAGMKEYAPPPIPAPLLEARELHLQMLRNLTGGDPQDTGGDHSHQISATESARRSDMADQRIVDKQESLGDCLGEVAKIILALTKAFKVKAIATRTVGAAGTTFETVDPSDLPSDIDVTVDLRAETESARAMEYAAVKDWGEFALAMQYPLMGNSEFVEYAGRKAGIRRPERFREAMAMPMGQPMDEGMRAIPFDSYAQGMNPAMNQSLG
jgi:hypothetical protein